MRFFVNVIAAAALLSNVVSGADLSIPAEGQIQVEKDKFKKGVNDTLGHDLPMQSVMVPTFDHGPGNSPEKVKDSNGGVKKENSSAKSDFLDKYIDPIFNKNKPKENKLPDSDLMVFVSFGMPDAEFTQYAEEARQKHAVLILRGFHEGTLKKTKLKALEVNKARVQMQINPNLFKAFKIDKVPAIVVASSNAKSVLEDGCAPEATYSAVFGNVSIETALETMARKAQPEIAEIAKSRLGKI